jgi:preprotein translocase subunit YajC
MLFYQELAMDFIFYILFAVIIIGIIYFIVRGKRT